MRKPRLRVEHPKQRESPRVWRGNLLNPVVAPRPANVTERRYPALGAYACPREDEDAIIGRNGEHVGA